jgi:uncharacterized protein YndB with AHSA1/START domain
MNEEQNTQNITIETNVFGSIDKVWESWTKPEHIVKWAHASAGWTTPFAENDVRIGGKFRTGFGSPDGKNDFVFEGIYTEIDEYKYIAYKIEDGREVRSYFEENGDSIRVTQTFQTEKINSIEQQQQGWSEILKNFRNYTESL